jgi:hypothetical protein
MRTLMAQISKNPEGTHAHTCSIRSDMTFN